MSDSNIDQKTYEKAVELLNIRQHTTGELQEKLKRKKFADEKITPVLRKLEKLDLLDDEKYVRIFVENMKLYKDWGYFGIRDKLIKKYVPSDIIEQVLAEHFTKEDEKKVLERVIDKLRRKGRDTYEKLARSLASKGFRNDLVISRLSEEDFD